MDSSRKKRLGQYFSGDKVAKLLIGMGTPSPRKSVIDPMAGIGDMLFAAADAGVPPQNIYGIEIDPIAGEECAKRISGGTVKIADAFKEKTYQSLGKNSWDFVITNPPYVRYQSMRRFHDQELTLQNAKEIRNNLLSIIRAASHLSTEERTCMLRIAENYSGLSDLAVPAWLLCASLVAPKGTLAMVVPESWLNREYAIIIKYLLLKFFDIQYVVEDLNSVWFSDALVKTNLIVAKRIAFQKELPVNSQNHYKHIRIGASLIGSKSLVQYIQYGGYTGERAFASLLAEEFDVQGEGFSIKSVSVHDMATELINAPAFRSLFPKLEGQKTPCLRRSVPIELYCALGENKFICNLVDLNSWGFTVGQGMRTGANRFFYAEAQSQEKDTEHIIVDKLFSNRQITVSKARIKTALRYQADVKDSLVVHATELQHRLFYIQSEPTLDESDLLHYIEEAENIEITSVGGVTRFPELSAVKPNIRTLIADGEVELRRWYMLPPLMPRHIPSLCISRINYKEPKCLFIPDNGIVVDANFSTLWEKEQSQNTIFAVFAMLNSSWAKAYMETISTVMGGGALKMEASHLRQLLLPEPTESRLHCFNELGKKLAAVPYNNRDAVIREIDYCLLFELFGADKARDGAEKLNVYLKNKVENRQR